MPGRFCIQQRIDFRENLAHRLAPFRVVRRTIEKIDLLERERALWPDRVGHTHSALRLTHAFKQAIHFARTGLVEQSEESLVIELLRGKEQFPLVDLIVEKCRECDREAIEEAFFDEGLDRRRHLWISGRHFRESRAPDCRPFRLYGPLATMPRWQRDPRGATAARFHRTKFLA